MLYLAASCDMLCGHDHHEAHAHQANGEGPQEQDGASCRRHHHRERWRGFRSARRARRSGLSAAEFTTASSFLTESGSTSRGSAETGSTETGSPGSDGSRAESIRVRRLVLVFAPETSSASIA